MKLAGVACCFAATIANLLGSAYAQDWNAFKASKNPSHKPFVAYAMKEDWWNICARWGRELRKRPKPTVAADIFREHLIAYDIINGVDLQNVRSRSIQIGMTSCGVYAVAGLPDKENRSHFPTRTTVQMVYRERGLYVYTEAKPGDGNGVVTAYQD